MDKEFLNWLEKQEYAYKYFQSPNVRFWVLFQTQQWSFVRWSWYEITYNDYR
jgi:hypothetical protein